MLQEISEIEDKAKGEALNNSTDYQAKEVELSDDPKKPDGSDEDPSESDGDEHEVTRNNLDR